MSQLRAVIHSIQNRKVFKIFFKIIAEMKKKNYIKIFENVNWMG